jgi:putative oxidoreductase
MMNAIVDFYGSCIKKVDRISWLGPLLGRIVVGIVFIESGWGKLHNLPKVIEFFQTLGIPAAQYQAPFVAGTEFLAGVFVLIGLATRLASVPLSAIMVVAIVTAKSSEITSWTDIFGFSEFLYLVILVWLIVQGAGLISLDVVISKKRRSIDLRTAK